MNKPVSSGKWWDPLNILPIRYNNKYFRSSNVVPSYVGNISNTIWVYRKSQNVDIFQRYQVNYKHVISPLPIF